MNAIDQLRMKLAEPVFATMSDANAAAAFRVPDSGTKILRNIDVGMLERYLAAEGILLTLRHEAATGKSGDVQVTAVAKELMALIDSNNVGTFGIHHVRAQGGLSLLVNATVITAVQRTEITAMGIVQQTIWQEIGLPNGTTDDVMRARSL